MKKKLTVLWGLSLLTLMACKDPIPDPAQTVLLLPENNTSCLYVSQSSTTASVDFSWQEADFTDAYKLVIRNLTTEEETISTTENTNIRLTLARGTPYQWKVVTTSALSSVETPSRNFSFYLEAQQQRNYLPFPARLLSPESNQLITLTNGAYNFSWQGEDLDNDLSHYTLLMGASADSLSEVATQISVNTYSLDLNVGQIYYWQIISFDLNGNSTKSLVFRFETAS